MRNLFIIALCLCVVPFTACDKTTQEPETQPAPVATQPVETQPAEVKGPPTIREKIEAVKDPITIEQVTAVLRVNGHNTFITEYISRIEASRHRYYTEADDSRDLEFLNGSHINIWYYDLEQPNGVDNMIKGLKNIATRSERFSTDVFMHKNLIFSVTEEKPENYEAIKSLIMGM